MRKIVLQTGLSREQIMKDIDDSIANVNGLLTRVGAALVLADKLKVKIDLDRLDSSSNGEDEQTTIKIKDMIEGMRNINVVGRVLNISPVRAFQRQDGRKGQVISLIVADNTGQVRVALWDQKATIVEQSIKQGEIIGIYNASTKKGRDGGIEINVDNRGMLKPKPDGTDEALFPKAQQAGSNLASTRPASRASKIKDIDENATFCSFTAKVLDKAAPRTFSRDGSDKQVARVTVGDESGTIPLVFWTDQMNLYDALEVGEVYDFDDFSIKDSKFSGGKEYHSNRTTKIEKSGKVLNVIISQASSTLPPRTTSRAASIKDIDESATFCSFTAKVLDKAEPRTFSRDGSEKKVARVTVGDESGTIPLVFWTDQMNLYDALEVGEVYDFDGFTIKDSKFSGGKEYQSNRTTKVEKSVKDLNITVPEHSIAPAPKPASRAASIKDIDEGATFCSFTAKVLDKAEPKIFSRDGSEKKVARVTVGDESGTIRLVFWTDQMNLYDALEVGEVYDFDGFTIKDSKFSGGKEYQSNRTTKVEKSGRIIDAEAVPPGETSAPAGIIDTFATIGEKGPSFTIEGKIGSKSDIKQFTKGDRQGSVGRLVLVDKNMQSIPVVFWNEKTPELATLSVGDVVQVTDVYARQGRDQIEVHAKDSSTITVIGNEEVSVSRVKIGDIKDKQSFIGFEGRVKHIDEIRDIPLKTGESVKNLKIIVGDETGSIGIVVWRDRVDELGNFKEGDAISIDGVSTSFNRFSNSVEVQLGSGTTITKPRSSSVPGLDQLPVDKPSPQSRGFSSQGPLQRIQLDELEADLRGEVLGRIVQISKYVNHYMACPKCKKKVTETNGVYTCANDGKVKNPAKRLIAKLTVDDGHGNITVSMIGDNVVDFFGLTPEESDQITEDSRRDAIIEKINNKFILKQYIFRGKVKYNDFRNEYEIIADRIVEPDLKSEITARLAAIESVA